MVSGGPHAGSMKSAAVAPAGPVTLVQLASRRCGLVRADRRPTPLQPIPTVTFGRQSRHRGQRQGRSESFAEESGGDHAAVLEHQDVAVIAEHSTFAGHSDSLTRLHGLQAGE